MKIKKFSFKKILSLLKREGSVEKKSLYSSHRDWTVIVITFFVLLVITISGHYALYVFVEKGAVFNRSAEQEEFRAALKRDVIDEAVTEFEGKSLNINSFNEIRSVLRDPS